MDDKKDDLVEAAVTTTEPKLGIGTGQVQMSPQQFMEYLRMMGGRRGKLRLTKKKVTREQRRAKRAAQKAARKANRGANQGKRAIKCEKRRVGLA